jgi:hypothetical protein
MDTSQHSAIMKLISNKNQLGAVVVEKHQYPDKCSLSLKGCVLIRKKKNKKKASHFWFSTKV